MISKVFFNLVDSVILYYYHVSLKTGPLYIPQFPSVWGLRVHTHLTPTACTLLQHWGSIAILADKANSHHCKNSFQSFSGKAFKVVSWIIVMLQIHAHHQGLLSLSVYNYQIIADKASWFENLQRMSNSLNINFFQAEPAVHVPFVLRMAQMGKQEFKQHWLCSPLLKHLHRNICVSGIRSYIC